MTAWVVQLDPSAATTGRTMLNLNTGAFAIGGESPGTSIDWGTAAINSYLAQAGQFGQGQVDWDIPNRTVTIPLLLGADDGAGGVSEEQARVKLQQKVGLLQREGGVLLRQRDGGPAAYLDIVYAEITVPDVWGETGGIESDLSLVLTCLPDFYGNEIGLAALTGTGHINGVPKGVGNFVPTPSFAHGVGAWANSGYGGRVIAGATLTAVSSGGPSGVSSSYLKVVTTSASANEGAALALTVNGFMLPIGTHEISLYVSCPSGSTGDQIEIIAGNPGNATLPVSLSSTWTRYAFQFTADGMSPSYIGVRTAAAVAATFYIAAILVVPVDSSTEGFVDGDTTGYAWAGTAGNSQTVTSGAAVIEGDYPARCRILVTDTSDHTQNGLLWGVRSRHYDSAATAALVYEAENLTAVGGSSVTSLTGASNGEVVSQAALPSNVWLSILSTQFATSAQATHEGSYRVRARVYVTSADMQMRFLWAPGSLSSFVTNDSVVVPGTGAFYLVDLGTVRIDALPTEQSWLGAVQVYAPNGGEAAIDQVFLQPLDEAAGQLTYSDALSPGVIVAGPNSPAIVEQAATLSGTTTAESLPWGWHGTTSSPYMICHNFGFVIPTGCTITGVEVAMTATGISTYPAANDQEALLLSGSASIGANQAQEEVRVPDPDVAFPASATWTYGGPSDLWSATLTPAIINANGIGFAFMAGAPGGSGATGGINVTAVKMTVYYSYAGFVVAADAVIYPDETCQMRSDGMYRSSPDGTVYGPVAQVIGDLPRLPASGLEKRPVEVFVKPSRGDLASLPDSGLDSMQMQVLYRPAWLSRP